MAKKEGTSGLKELAAKLSGGNTSKQNANLKNTSAQVKTMHVRKAGRGK